MRTACLLAPVALFLAALAPAADDPPKPDAKALAALTGEQLYPLRVGERRVYNVKGTEKAVVLEVAAEEKVGDAPAFKVVGKVDGKEVAVEHMRVTKDGVYRVRFAGADADPPLRLVKLPAKDGDTWDGTHEIAGKKVTVKSRLFVQDVKVPAGEFKGAVAVETKGEDDGNVFVSTVYLAPKIGMVKQVMNVGGEETTLLLEKVEPAGK